jgi:hypothetical protein
MYSRITQTNWIFIFFIFQYTLGKFSILPFWAFFSGSYFLYFSLQDISKFLYHKSLNVQCERLYQNTSILCLNLFTWFWGLDEKITKKEENRIRLLIVLIIFLNITMLDLYCKWVYYTYIFGENMFKLMVENQIT